MENKIVLIVPTGNEAGLEAFEDIEKSILYRLGDPGQCTGRSVCRGSAHKSWDLGSDQDKVSFGTNVTEVLNQVAASSADAGIVYATDAASMAEQVDVIAEAPEGSLKRR